jgi:ATP-dependent exoDNAse (exonuclease V) beta subunit
VAESSGALGYGDMAVLCRGYRGFGAYEDAFEAAGIPYETVAGRGFLERPEVRDLLNALAALADPSDDLALLGLLRSPAIALPDAELHRLRLGDAGQPQNLWRALCADEAETSRRAAALIDSLHALAGRVAVADLLKQFIDATHYRAILLDAGESRAARNVGKLLQDAQKAGIVSVGQFLDYVKGLRAAGSREGEARADSSGAVQIMTVHQAKGLEFPIVVIGDAGSTPYGGGDVILDGVLGVVPHMARDKRTPLVWQMARRRDQRKEAAEDLRLLYVAATRAQERLLVSGHVRLAKAGKITADGWLGAICAASGMTEAPGDFQPGGGSAAHLAFTPPAGWQASAVCGMMYGIDYTPASSGRPPVRAEQEVSAPLAAPLLPPLPPVPTPDAEHRPNRIWRVAPPAEVRWAPAWVVGKLVHAAIAAWRRPEEYDFDAWCQANARSHGLGAGPQVAEALRRVRRILLQFRRHPLFGEIEGAEQRFHELPFTGPDGVDDAHQGQIDLLFRSRGQWTLVDFKTDRIRDERGRAAVESLYRPQVERYAAAVTYFLGVTPRCLLCLLDDQGATNVIPIRLLREPDPSLGGF